MEAQISADMKTPVLSHRPGPEGSAGDKGRKRESEALGRTQSGERDQQVNPPDTLPSRCARRALPPVGGGGGVLFTVKYVYRRTCGSV